MNKKLILVFIILFAAIGATGFIEWELFTPPKSNHRATVWDSSTSSDNRCSEIVRINELAIKKQPTNSATKLAVFLTGDQQTANEPRGLGSFNVPLKVKLTQGNTAIETEQNRIVNEVKSKCEQLPPATASSIFLAFKRAVEYLKNLGCDDTSGCEILAQTDLQENADAQIKAVLSGASKDFKNLPAPLNNQGITIKICGVSQTKGLVIDKKGNKTQLTQNRNASRVDFIQEVWKKLFTHPELVVFSSYCSE
jgi:hypothetical protein